MPEYTCYRVRRGESTYRNISHFSALYDILYNIVCHLCPVLDHLPQFVPSLRFFAGVHLLLYFSSLAIS